MDDYDLTTPTTIEGPAYECCEMKIATFVCLACVMAVIFVIALVWFIRRNCLTEKYKFSKPTAKKSGSPAQLYTSVQQGPILC